jgi:hypothetical protein
LGVAVTATGARLASAAGASLMITGSTASKRTALNEDKRPSRSTNTLVARDWANSTLSSPTLARSWTQSTPHIPPFPWRISVCCSSESFDAVLYTSMRPQSPAAGAGLALSMRTGQLAVPSARSEPRSRTLIVTSGARRTTVHGASVRVAETVTLLRTS